MQRLFFFLVLFTLLDLYVFVAIKGLVDGQSPVLRRTVFVAYWGLTLLLLSGILLYRQLDPRVFKDLRLYLTTAFGILFFAKVFAALFLLIDDVRRGVAFLVNLFPATNDSFSTSRSNFMRKTAVVAGAVPIATMSFGIISGAHDYRVRRRTVHLPRLPKAFDGLRAVQISDIHTGSFFNKTAVMGGVDMLNAEKPDIVFFTGDLVNNQSKEAKDYLDIFKKVKGDMGVYSVMGNHDYGDYYEWATPQEKAKDVQNLQDMHRYMGYDILLNENRTLKVDGEEISILGCENWGSGRFAKYGDLEKTVQGSEDSPFKILLSHDPSHWDAQVRPNYSDIDLTLSGHTHGMQFGIEIGNFRWSPVKYRYKQWADLYQEGEQYLYVNRGFGYIGYPGRIGILPEITVLELKSS